MTDKLVDGVVASDIFTQEEEITARAEEACGV
jgi:hypothetical protein